MEKEFHNFSPSESLEGYALMRSAVQYVADNCREHLSPDGMKVIGYPSVIIEDNFRLSLELALQGANSALMEQAVTKEGLERKATLVRMRELLESSLALVGREAVQAITLLHGIDSRLIRSRLDDARAQELMGEAEATLELLILLGNESLASEVCEAYGRYHEYIRELVTLYDAKMSRNDEGKTILLSELYQRQERRFQEVWFFSLLRAEG